MPGLTAPQEPRVFEFTYQMLAAEFPTTEAVDIYIPLPAEHAGQNIISQTLRSTMPGERGREQKFNNGYYHIHRPANVNAPIDVSLSWTVSRQTVLAGDDIPFGL